MDFAVISDHGVSSCIICTDAFVFFCTPGQTAVELARDTQMQQVLCVRPIRQLQKSATRFEGQLLKRSRFLGWKPIWVSFTSLLSMVLCSQFYSLLPVVPEDNRRSYEV
jgi:hypothetical protein